MKTKNKNINNEFHAVDFMRRVRQESSAKYMQNKDQYLKDLRMVMDDFKRKQEKAYSQHASSQIAG